MTSNINPKVCYIELQSTSSNQHKNGDQKNNNNNTFSLNPIVVAQIMLFLVLVPKSDFQIRLLEANTQSNHGMGFALIRVCIQQIKRVISSKVFT